MILIYNSNSNHHPCFKYHSLYPFVVFRVCSSCVSIGVFESGESVNSSGSSLFLSQPDWNMGFSWI